MDNRNGFTLMEILIAVVLLVIVATTTAKFASDFTRTMTKSSIRVAASAVARDRLELVRADPRYTRLGTLYAVGAGADTLGFPGFPRMRRTTTVVRDTTGSAPRRDRTTVTVRITDPALRDTVALTSVIASP